MPPVYTNNDIVRVTRDGWVIDHTGDELIVHYNGDDTTTVVPLSRATVERVGTALDVVPGQIWQVTHGGLWLARKHYADHDDPDDWEGCNAAGWRTVLTPLDGGPYGNREGRPDEIHREHGLVRLVNFEPVCVCTDLTPDGGLRHAATCPQPQPEPETQQEVQNP